MDYPREEATADTQLLIEFNDVGDGSSLPRDVLWAIARNKLQIELYNCLVREEFNRHTWGTTSRACQIGSVGKMKLEPTTIEP